MIVERHKVSELNEAPYNPRRMTEAAKSGLKASIDRFGMVVPMVWNKRTGNLVGGHQRLAVLKDGGMSGDDEIEVVVVDVDDEKEKALNLALNNPGSRGKFTEDAVGILESLEKGARDLYDSLNLGELRFVIERTDMGGPRGAGKSRSGGKKDFDGLECPRCGAAWNKKTGQVIRGGKGAGS
jgi:ParB-like chromosome segregation protein Spo0J